jgi:FkbM family methyltransferase
MATSDKVYTFYSQQGEDIFVYKHFLNQPVTDGVFVEVGAYDGVAGSNTKFFEDVLGYSGLLIEPMTEFVDTIRARRPRANLFPVAIHPTQSSVTFLGENAAAGIAETMSDAHKRLWFPTGGMARTVPAFRLGDICGASGIAHIDFLSIDVEGGELLVLESMDWGAVDVFVVVIELDETHPEKDTACRTILQQAGFTFQTRIGNNDLWVNLHYSKRHSRYGPIEPYTASFEYLNAQSREELPRLLSEFVSPI